jgi:sialidase-1
MLTCLVPGLAACGRLGYIGISPAAADGGAPDGTSSAALDADTDGASPGDAGLSALHTGLVALYTFDGTPGQAVSSVVDVLGSGSNSSSITDADATLVYVPGRLDQAIYLDGADDRIVISAASGTFDFGTGDFTLAAWVRVPGNCPSTWCNLFGGGELDPGMALELSGSEELNFYVQGDSGYHNTTGDPGTPVRLNDDQWHHVAGVKSGADMASYVDGQESQRGLDVISGVVNVPLLHVGDHYSTQETAVHLDEVAIWKRSLTAAEIAMLPTAGSLKP